MATKTGAELIDAVKSHLGDRDTGKIGSEEVSVAIRDSLNRSMYDIARKHSVNELEAIATISVSSSAYEYALPTTDTDSSTILIKNILVANMVKVGETNTYTLIRIGARQRYRAFSDVTNTQTGYPTHYTEFRGKLNLYPYPDTNYTITLYVNTWPTLFDENNIATAHPFGEYFNDLIENFAVADCFYKLGQIDDATLFHAKYEVSLQRTVGAVRVKPDWDVPTLITSKSADPASDPFVRHWGA